MNEAESTSHRLIEAFNEAQGRPPGESRRQFLDAACAGDEELRVEVEQLLSADQEADGFLEVDAARSPGIETGDSRVPEETAGERIGPYKLLEQIGEGGFGTVWVAEQERPLRRRVALKILKPGMDSRQVLARFETERQALAIMDHPNIATVFDGGATSSGRPYFVMELVKGMVITEFCDQHQLTPRARLELFVQVCHAVQHAHQKGIIHRDLKPSNVLVMAHDTIPVVKVIDFGIAKALGEELTDKTVYTRFAQLLGTPLYMSPEQAGESSVDVDTRSDIYSLGVLLYELLTGATPFDKERFKQAAQDEIRRILREEDPPRPSTRLSESKDSLLSISTQRDTEPAKLTRLVRGELDWIVMKALEKDRSRRYETASGFAMDVQRYLADEPVVACPPTTAYRLKKFARRNKGGLAIAALVMFFFLLLGSGIGWSVRDRSVREAKVAAQIDLILTEVGQFQREQQWAVALAAARRAEVAVNSGEATAEDVARVRAVLKDVEFVDRLDQIRMQKAKWVGGKFDYAGADREYARAFRDFGADVAELGVETSIDRLRAHPALVIPSAAALTDWATAQSASRSDTAAAKRLLAVAQGIDPDPMRTRLRSTWDDPASENGDELRLLAESIDVRAHHPETLGILADVLEQVNHADAALRLRRDAQRVHPEDFWLNFNLGAQLHQNQDHEGAVRFYTAAVSIRPNAVAALNNLGNVLEAQGKWEEAIAVYHRAIELDPGFATALANLGVAYQAQQKLDEAVAAYRKAIELDPGFAAAHYNLGLVLQFRNMQDEAATAFLKAIELAPEFAPAHFNLAFALQALEKPDDAIAAYRKAIELDPNRPEAHYNLGVVLFGQKEMDAAIACWGKAIELDPRIVDAHVNLGLALHIQKQPDAAIAAYRKAIELDPADAGVYNHLGLALRDQGKVEEALAAHKEAIAIDPESAAAHSTLAWLLVTCSDGKLRDPELALTMARKAVELAPANPDGPRSLGAAYYRIGDWKAAITALEESMELRNGGDSLDWFLLAMAYWQLGNKEEEAHRWYDRAIEWMEKYDPKSESVNHLRNEAAELLGVNGPG